MDSDHKAASLKYMHFACKLIFKCLHIHTLGKRCTKCSTENFHVLKLEKVEKAQYGHLPSSIDSVLQCRLRNFVFSFIHPKIYFLIMNVLQSNELEAVLVVSTINTFINKYIYLFMYRSFEAGFLTSSEAYF